MTDERYNELMFGADISMAPDEIEAGWHYCPDWDLMLIGTDSPEAECCSCELEIDDGKAKEKT